MAIRLRVHLPDEAALLRVFDSGDPVTLGRAPDNSIPLEHGSVSRHHAVIEPDGATWRVRDLGSKNGVRIEGRRVDSAPLASGQWLSIGDVFCEFALLGAGEVEAARAREGQRRHDSRLFAQRVAAAASPAALAAELLRAIVDLSECQRGFLVVGNGALGLNVRAVYNVDPQEIAGNRFSGSTGAIDRALRQRRPVFLSDGQDYAWLKGRASVVSRGLRAIVVVPLENEGRMLGAAYADSDDAGRVFTDLDAELLSAFAAQASLVLAAGALDEQLTRMQSLVAVHADGATHDAGQRAGLARDRAMTAPGRGLEGAQAATVTGLFASAELASGELIAGRFRVEDLLGIGGMGVVYRARDEQLGVPVALKLLRPELASRPDAFARFRQEILLARQVSSAHVVRIHDLVQHEGRWLISMDFVDGPSLEKLIDDGGAMPPEVALRIARDVAEGLAAAHRRQVVHRDLKPANVLVDGQGAAFISDFGVARSAGVTGVTGSGVVVGTPEYLSPEQARADPVDARSDLYALGLILYEMLAGKLPFPSGTPAETLAQRIVRSPPAISKARPELPGWIVRLVARLLQLKPQRRFQRAEDVVRAIETKHVPGQLPEGRGALTLLVAVLAIGGFGFAVRELVRRDATQLAPAAVAVTAPPVVALPFAAPAGDASLARALDALLRAGLAAGGSSVDAERITRTQKLLGYDDDAARRNGNAIAARLGATVVVEPALARDGDRYQLTLARRNVDGSAAGAPLASGSVQLDALPVALRELVARAGLGLDGDGWPVGGEALAALGEAEVARAAGDVAAAEAGYAKAVAAEPRFALAWLSRLALAGRGSDHQALASEAQSSLRGARGRAAEQSRALAELASDASERAVERLTALAAARAADGTTRVALAQAQEAAGDDDAARKTLAAIVADDEQNAAAWFALGRLAVRGGEAQRGVDEYLVRAQVLYTRLGDRRGQGDTANAIGLGYERLGQVDEAVAQFERAASLREQAGDVRGAAASLRNLSATRAVRGDYDAAEADLARARTLLAPLGDAAGLADVANDAGLLAEERGDYAAALVAYREALAQRQPLGDERLLAESLLNVGFAYFQTGEFDSADSYWRQSLARAHGAKNSPGEVRAQQSLGLLATARGDWREARTQLDASLVAAESQQMLEEQAVSLTYLAELDRLEGKLADALARASKARVLFTARDDARGIAELDLIVAQAALDAGAADAAEQALAVFAQEPPGNTEQQSMLAQRRSELALLRGDSAAAQREAATAREQAQAAHGTAVLAAAELAAARAAARGGDAAGARAALARVDAVLARFPSLPLALERALAGSEARFDPRSFADAQGRIAGLPGYGRAWLLQAAAANAARARGDEGAARAADAAAAAARPAWPAQEKVP